MKKIPQRQRLWGIECVKKVTFAAFPKNYYMARVFTSSPIFSMNSSRLIT